MMRTWGESQGDVRKVGPDKEMARAILKMVKVRLKAMTLDREEFASLIVEDYYEILKEMITALMAIDGYKTLSHEVLIGYLKEFFPQFSEAEVLLADQLRQLRNKIAYKGFFVTPDYLERNETKIRKMILALERVLEERLGTE
jgi:hypothetical protein